MNETTVEIIVDYVFFSFVTCFSSFTKRKKECIKSSGSHISDIMTGKKYGRLFIYSYLKPQ